jgi:hypothetical protein
MSPAFAFLPPSSPHTVQSDTTRCGASRVGHAAKRPLLHLSILLLNNHQNNIVLLFDDNALFLLGNVVLQRLVIGLKERTKQ